MLAVGLASRSIAGRPANYWNFGFNHSFWGPRNGHPFHPNNNNTTRPPKKFIVGGSEHWRYGFNYTDWALNNGPFYVNDTLVFKYDPPSKTTFPHSVYLLPNPWSFLTCDLSKAEQVATVAQGGGDDEVLCDAAAWSLPWLINGELAREEEDAVLQCFRLLLIWKQQDLSCGRI
ncbi:hypothetical protein CK203_020616 [Vitis vinifera]|uniref:Phytocyanin domain-containing protein n=1 Tax=Vitis vinifera TaxID=29760 RepID=A0A438FMR1_VITVI|nr:hypothetical protein CK203_020616 [Vitis vinifera]